MNYREVNFIETFSGGTFHLTIPAPEDVSIQDIAHSLSLLCRFTGHTRQFYSVAQHSVLVSTLVPQDLALEGLLHDASEAYIGDLSSPLKGVILESTTAFLDIETHIHEVIAKRFGTTFPHPPEIKEADNIAVVTERRDFMMPNGTEWAGMPAPLEEELVAMSSTVARAAFLDRFKELTS